MLSAFQSWLKQLNPRVWFGLAWAGALMLLLVLFFELASPIFLGLEQDVLDIRLRLRAKQLTPSEDIVIVAVDRATQAYIRTHPELNIPSKRLPRERLAHIIDYVNQDGAKAVVLDVELREPDAGDSVLADTIRRGGNVYAAARLDTPLEDFVDYNRSAQLDALAPYDEFFHHDLMPFLVQKSRQNALWFPRLLRPAYFTPFLPAAPTLHIPEPSLLGVIQQKDLEARLSRKLSGRLADRPQPLNGLGTQDILNRFYTGLCTRQNYQQSYYNDSNFLPVLAENAVPLTIEATTSGARPGIDTYCYAGAVVPQILSGLKGLGITTVNYDTDGVLRQVSPFYRAYQGRTYAYLGIRPAIDLMGLSDFKLRNGVLSWKTGNGSKNSLPLSEEQQLLINWRHPGRMIQHQLMEAGYSKGRAKKMAQSVSMDKNNPLLGGGHLYRSVSAIDVLREAENNHIEDEPTNTLYKVPGHPESGLFSFQNKVVFYADTITDIDHASVGRHTYGVEVLATVMDMFTSPDEVFVQKAPRWVSNGLIGLLLGLIMFSTLRASNLLLDFAYGVILILLYWLLNFIVFINYGYWLPVINATYFMLTGILVAILLRYYIRDRDLQFLTRVFSNYVSPQVMRRILSDPARAQENLKGQKREMTVIFTDIKGFTRQFENADPEMLMNQLSVYFDAMIEIILKYEGTYDKFMGDGLIAFFGAPVPFNDHAEKACQVALEMQQALQHLNRDFAEFGGRQLEHGIGISTGDMFVGNFGSSNIKNYTVMGSTVNLGSRLQAYTREIDHNILISKATYDKIKDIAVTDFIGEVEIRGFTERLSVYALISVNQPLK